ncbi:MAG: T9SS type A sorting domain-containing protein [Bacteroidales bacterium]|nr:T9SS type A sorting domain-containing protein [Bacteroidales bacterium]
MKKHLFVLCAIAFSLSAMAQNNIRLRTTDKAACEKSDMTGLKASFSFSGLEVRELQSERGVFSTLTMPNTVIGGNEGEPQIPVVNQLIAIPFGATPTISVTHYSTTDFNLEEYGIHTLSPRQPDVWKDENPENVPFAYNEAAYQTRGLRTEPVVRVGVEGTLRGVRVGQMSIEPVSYDPVSNTIRVFNDIEVEVRFDGTDAKATEAILEKTYSPYFTGIYDQLFNGRALRDIYDEHPDLWSAPVKMLVIANRMFENCIQNWVAWKTLKGIYVDVNYTDVIGSTAEEIQSFIRDKYAQDAPSFLMIMGDQDQVVPSGIGSKTGCVTDLLYSSVDDDQFPDMLHSRLSAETVAQMTAMLNKGMEYEQYAMPDPSYLNNVLFVAGYDNTGWDITVGRPTVWYATNYYYNAEHGFANVNEFSHGSFDNCYTYLNSGVGFANYTAHGTESSWMNPEFTVDDVNNLTNEHKYFLAMGNCCKTGNWGFETPCFGETMTRAENKGAYAYIGSCPSTTWFNDYYFGVGATTHADGTMPTYEETTMGCYDAIWRNDAYNTVCAILYSGNLAGNAARALGYPVHCNPLYYWQAYHVLGDGSIMPYRVQPTPNIVSHLDILPIGIDSYEVDAVPGSYVAISKDGVLLGTALVGESGRAYVPITPVTEACNVTLCVTAPQRIPFIETIPAATIESAYISVDSFTPSQAHVGDYTDLSISFKNVGTEATSGITTVTLTSEDPNVVIDSDVNTFGTLVAAAITTVSGFQFHIVPGVADGELVTIHYAAANGAQTWEGNIVVNANEAVLAYHDMHWDGSFVPGETITVTTRFRNKGHYQANEAVATMSSTSDYITISNPSISIGTIGMDEMVTCQFTATIAANCPEDEQIPVTFTLEANGGLTVQGHETLKNSCKVVFELSDSYGDGWNGNKLYVSFDDGSPTQELTIEKGGGAFYELEIGHGVHVTLTWHSASMASECSFVVKYENDFVIYQTSGTPTSGVLYEFDCNCASAYQTYTVTVAPDVTGHGTVTGGGVFDYGQSCTVTATPADDYFFINWTLNNSIVSYTPTYTFNVTSDMELVANFVEGRVIGDGGDATSDYLPSYSLYKNTLSEQIYTSEEFGDAGVITSIAFYNGGTEKTRYYDFYMKNTSKSSFTGNRDWETISTSDKVFSGGVTMVANDWTVITLNPPFFYDGTSNVVLVSDDHTTTNTSSGLKCRVFNAQSQAIRVYNESTDYDPTNTSTYYGTIMNVKNQLRITKAAPSTEPVNITVSANPAQGGIVTGGGEYTFGETCTVTATANTGYFFIGWTENDEIISNDLEISFVALNDRTLVASFIQATEIGTGETTNNYLPSYSYYNYALSQQIYTPQEIGMAGTISCMAFYNEGAERTRTYDFYLATTDKSFFSDNVDWITVAESDKVFSGSVTMAANAWTFIVFDTPFDYDGTSNLVIVADDNSGRYDTSPYMSCSVYNTSTSQAIYSYSSYTNYNPMSPPTTSGSTTYNPNANAVLSVKNHLLLGISTSQAQTITINAYSGDGGYYLISVPFEEVDPETVEHMLDNDFDLYTFDESQDYEWINYKASSYNLEAGKGYLYANSNNVTLSFTGTPYSGNGEVALSYTPNAEFPGFNLIGNPYASNATLDMPYYRLNNEGSALKAETENTAIAVLEGVFVRASAASQKATFTTQNAEQKAIARTNIMVSGSHGNVLDNAIIRFDGGATLGKFQLNANSTKVYFSQENKDYAIVGADNEGEIPIYFKAEKNDSYTMSFTNEEVALSYLHLIDNLTGADVDLLQTPSYSFHAKTTDYASRFKLVFATGENDDNFAFVSNGEIIINGEGTVQVIDMLGRVIGTWSTEKSISTNGMTSGVYVLILIGEQVKTQKIIVK